MSLLRKIYDWLEDRTTPADLKGFVRYEREKKRRLKGQEEKDNFLMDVSKIKDEIKRRVAGSELSGYGNLEFPYWALIRATNLGALEWSKWEYKGDEYRGKKKECVADLGDGWKLIFYMLFHTSTWHLDLTTTGIKKIAIMTPDYEGMTGFDLVNRRLVLKDAIESQTGGNN